jgi:hypothetical protein
MLLQKKRPKLPFLLKPNLEIKMPSLASNKAKIDVATHTLLVNQVQVKLP